MPSSGMLCHVPLARNDSCHPDDGGPKLEILLRSVCRLLVMANVVPSSPILVTLMMEALSSSKTLVLTRATWHNIPEDGILHHVYLNVFAYPSEYGQSDCGFSHPLKKYIYECCDVGTLYF
jgi:hypothetical protein